MDWRHRAACRDEDPELFFPVGTTVRPCCRSPQAKAVCHRCTVASDVPDLGARERPGRRRVGRDERGRATRAQAAQRPDPDAQQRLIED